MSAMRRLGAVCAAALAVVLSAGNAVAVPTFARRYGVECHMCHQGFPKLNKTGHRFKERGFRLEDEDPFKPSDWIKSVPLRARASIAHYLPEAGGGSTTGFIRLVSASSLGSRVSYWVDSGLLFDESSDTYVEPADAWVRLELLREGKLYVRAGRMELDLPFTQTRTPHLFSYPVYFANSGSETDTIGTYHRAVEIGGLLGGETYHWSAAVTSGAEDPRGDELFRAAGASAETGRFEGNVYMRASRRSETTRVGLFSYFGRNQVAQSRGPGVRPQTWEDDLLRVGADLDIWPSSRLNLYGVYLYGRNSDSTPASRGTGGSGRRATFHGGFGQADFHVFEKPFPGFLKEVAVALTLRASWVRVPTASLAGKQSPSSVSPGIHVWVRERLRLSAEYNLEGQGRDDIGAVQAELVF
jgi:hypothetical protein